MCGIAGVYDIHKLDDAFGQLFSAVSHRGPDASGTYRDERLAMGMHRLRFRGADIPLPIRDERGVAAYNGQVYGYFKADGGYIAIVDGLHAEMAVAFDLESRPDGMFAYSRYSRRSRELVLRTDPHFIKPLFFRRSDGGGISFCSEIAPLLRSGHVNRLNWEALAELFAYGWYLGDDSWIDDVFLVWKNDVAIGEAGIRMDPKNGTLAPPRGTGDPAHLRDAIRTSIQRSIRGTGPVGLALSGGFDSTILAHELNELGFEDLICITVLPDEGEDSLTSLSELGLPAGGAWRAWRHIVVPIGDADFLKSFEASTKDFGQPTTMSSLPLYRRLADAAADAGVRALILGEGVDEYFAGYSSYAKLHSTGDPLDYYRHPPRERLTRALFGDAAVAAAEQRFRTLYGEVADLRGVEVQMRLTRLLLRSDVCLMARSIEGRVPFLYNGIPALAMTLPWAALTQGQGKWVLRQLYAPQLGPRAFASKVRFKAPDAMLMRCMSSDVLQGRIMAAAGSILGRDPIERVLRLLSDPSAYDADVACLLLSLTFLIEYGILDGYGS